MKSKTELTEMHQECIPVGYVPLASVSVSTRGGGSASGFRSVCLRVWGGVCLRVQGVQTPPWQTLPWAEPPGRYDH